MSNVAVWFNLPQEMVNEIANHLSSKVELLRMRSICKFWRSAIVATKRFPNRDKRNRKRLLPHKDGENCLLSPAAFFRVILSSYPDNGWLIKAQDVDVDEYRKRLLCPLSRFSMEFSDQTLDLLDFTVSEIHQTFDVKDLDKTSYDFARVILVDNLVFAVDKEKQIWWCNGEENKNNNNEYWTRILDEEVKYFSDIIVHEGQIYALDLKGAVWWVSLYDELNIYQYQSSTPMDYYNNNDETCHCKDKRLIEYGGDLCVILRFSKRFRVKRTNVVEKTVGFKVYKMDMELLEWVEVKSLLDKAFVMATDSCFEILAREYYGCLENSIYFIDEEEQNNVKVFKLSDYSITKMVKSSSSSSSYQSCFQMFSPPFA